MKIVQNFQIVDLGGEIVMVPTGQAGERFHGIVRLNETAAFIVNCLKKETTPDQIVDDLLAEYDVERSDAARHVNALLVRLDEIGAVERKT